MDERVPSEYTAHRSGIGVERVDSANVERYAGIGRSTVCDEVGHEVDAARSNPTTYKVVRPVPGPQPASIAVPVI